MIWIKDISEFVQEQYQNINDFWTLVVPSEAVYPVTDVEVATRLQVSASK